MKFRGPVLIIDEDFRPEITSGLGIRAPAGAIESEGFAVVGVTSHGDPLQFAQQLSRVGPATVQGPPRQQRAVPALHA